MDETIHFFAVCTYVCMYQLKMTRGEMAYVRLRKMT